MDCKAVQQQIFNFIYGEGAPHELAKTKEHLDKCGHCREEREIIAEILKQMEQCLADDPVPAGFHDRVLTRLRKEGFAG